MAAQTSERRFVHGVPRVPDAALHRERLLARLGRAPVTVLRAPGGSGKTVIMAQWALQGAYDGIWVTVEPDIGERVAFWCAVSALNRAGVALSAAELAAVRQDVTGDDAFRSIIVRSWGAAIEPFALIVDDAQNLIDPRIADDLLAVVRACRNVSLVVATRSASRFDAHDVALTLDRELIGAEDITFSVAEVGAMITEDTEATVEAAQLHAATGGNGLLLRAMLHSGDRAWSGSPHDLALVAVRQHWHQLTRSDRELGRFGLDTAIPDNFDRYLARRLSGLTDVDGHISRLESEGLIMRTATSTGARYRYHPLLREVLRAERIRTSKVEFRRLSAIAAIAADERGHPLAALRHSVEAEDYELTSAIILHGGIALIRGTGVAAVLRSVPIRQLARFPLIGAVLALGANARGERWRALELFAVTLTASRATRSRQMSAERIALDVIESIVFRVTGRASEAVAPARRALARIDETGGGELGAIAHQLDSLRVQCALAFFRGGAIADAAQIVARVERPVDAESDVPLQLGALSLAAAVSVVHGQMPEAARALRVIDESGSPVEVLNSYSGSLAHLARAIMGAEAGDIRTVHAHIEALDAHMPTLEYRLLFAAVQALAALWDGDPAQALHDLAALRREDAPRARISRSDERILGVTRALLYSALSETGAAQDEVRRLPVNDGLRILLDAHLMLIGRRPELAFPRLAQVNPGEHDDRLRAMRDILMACAALASGDRTAAATALRRYAATVSANGLMTPLLLVPVEHRDDMLAFAGSLGGVPVAALQRLVELPPVFRLTRIRASLTPRERDIVLGLRATSSLTTIAESLGLSRNTVKAQVRTLYRKLNVGSRSEALRAAYAQGLLSADLSPERPQDAE